MKPVSVAVIGAGPAGLMAAEVLAEAGVQVDVYDAMPSPGRKFLRAGIGGLNITHAESLPAFQSRYGEQQAWVADWINAFTPELLCTWVHALGIETFVGTSGRVFPREMKASPLLRRWLQRLRATGVRFHMLHRWQGRDASGQFMFECPAGTLAIRPDAVILALGGASWPRLGSDGSWVPLLQAHDVQISPWQPANCGFDVATPGNPAGWSEYFAKRFAGTALKNVAASVLTMPEHVRGECIMTATGMEGGLIYALSRPLRDQIRIHGLATLLLDLLPDRDHQALAVALARPRGKLSWSSFLRKAVGIDGVKLALLQEWAPQARAGNTAQLAGLLKALPINLRAARPLDEAISCAGGVSQGSLDTQLMLRHCPGIFCAGEMLDWEAPTGGYLLTACLASGRAAGAGALSWLSTRSAEAIK